MAIKLTEKAIDQIKKIVASQEEITLESTFVRVGIRGKNCSGTVYAFGLDDHSDPDIDEISLQDGIKIVHEKQFSKELDSVTVDFKELENDRGFTFVNALQVLSQGCCGGGGGCGTGGCDA